MDNPSSPKKKKEERTVFVLLGVLLVVFVFLTFIHRIFVVVPAGHSGVLWRLNGGTVSDESYSEGLHLLLPWNELAIYNTRLQSATREFKAQSLGGLTLTTTVTFRYRPYPNKLATLHKEIGRNYLDEYIVPELGALVATQVAGRDHESIYANRTKLAADLTRSVTDGNDLSAPLSNGQRERLIEIPEIFVNEVVLPPDVDEVVKSKFAKIERLEAAEYDKKLQLLNNEILEMEGRGVAKFQSILGKGLEPYLTWKSIEATRDAGTSENSKIVIMGPGQTAPVLVQP